MYVWHGTAWADEYKCEIGNLTSRLEGLCVMIRVYAYGKNKRLFEISFDCFACVRSLACNLGCSSSW